VRLIVPASRKFAPVPSALVFQPPNVQFVLRRLPWAAERVTLEELVVEFCVVGTVPEVALFPS
jgi:hypothetical protein